MTRQIDIAGKSGAIYRYTELDEGRPQPPAGANYIVAEVNERGVAVIFAGETDNLSRGDWREALAKARDEGQKVRMLTRLNVRSAVRLAEQTDVVEQHRPPMNGAPPEASPEAQASGGDPQ